MTKRPEYVAWDAGVRDGLATSRVEAFGALRRVARFARHIERDAPDQAYAIRLATRIAIRGGES